VSSSEAVQARSVSRCRQAVAMMSGWARPTPGILAPRTAQGQADATHSAGDVILVGYHDGYRTSCRNLAMTCGNAVGGTRFELVTSSVSGRPASCLSLPLNAPESTSPGRTLPHGAPGMPPPLRRMAPALAPALAPWPPCSGTVDARIPPLGHDTASITATSASMLLPLQYWLFCARPS
jgi:hypothetical protein